MSDCENSASCFNQNGESSFLSTNISGKHMIVDLKGVRNLDLMSSVEGISQILDDVCKAHNYNVLARTGHAFSPIGATVLYLLSESHISIHTFPERGYAAVDIYTCKDMPDNSEYLDIHRSLVAAFDADLDDSPPLILNRSFV